MIDWQRVTTLRDEIGAEDFEEVVPMFLEEVEAVTDELRTNPDVTKLEDHMHFLKGCAVSLGFAAFSDMCNDGEVLAAAGKGTEIDVPAILDCYEASKTAFMTGLAQGAAA
ncbi:Hpt domain-containing protein [uncultured Tateyamaria sp.]|uniref:Hpt domain-containing protein n=1 Tax=uncultured Tateyamaria sp. TaxID=455651 RepID=UPI00262A55BC|nr:Hpt domain-containing protein [uncultured Tateyamaria sp.]